MLNPQSRCQHPHEEAWGFTLIELMITLAVAGLILALAVPSFLDAQRKGRRADAVAAIAQVQQAQERWRASNATYSTKLTEDLAVPASSPNGHYSLAIDGAGATGYTITATASSTQQMADLRCKSMRAEADKGQLKYSAQCAGCSSYNEADPDRCWAR